MSDNMTILKAELRRVTAVTDDIQSRLDTFHSREFKEWGRTQVNAVFIAQVLDNYYTALETLFFRISEFFENSLRSERWHKDLLDKMMLHIPGIRERVISEQTGSLLKELLRFRHFKRYYFELDFDWKKLDYLLDVYERVRPKVLTDLQDFQCFLNSLQE
jgi:hypothetical protein